MGPVARRSTKRHRALSSFYESDMTHAKHRSSIGRRKQLTKGRRHQRGHGPDVIGLAKLILWLIVIFVAATIGIPAFLAFKLQSIWLGLAVLGVALGWVYYVVAHMWLPSKRNDDWRRWSDGARAICMQEIGLLPERVLARSLLDETTALTGRQIVQLLSERGLDFLEIKLATREGVPQVIAWGSGVNRFPLWLLPKPGAPYVRLRLSAEVDSEHKPGKSPRHTLIKLAGQPGKLLAAEAIELPTAELAIELEPACKESLGPYGKRKLIRRETREVLAQLSTWETAETTYQSSDDHLTKPAEEPKSPRHASPHLILANLVFSPQYEWDKDSAQVFRFVTVEPSRSLNEILSDSERLPVVLVANETVAFLSREEGGKLTQRVPWVDAVADARHSSTGTAPYGACLVDAGRKALIKLSHAESQGWQPHAAQDGFFLIKDIVEQDCAPRKLLVRFRNDGEFEWAVSVAPPPDQSNEPMWRQNALYIDQDCLVLADWGRLVKPEDHAPAGALTRSPRWEIPLASLPAMTPVRRDPA